MPTRLPAGLLALLPLLFAAAPARADDPFLRRTATVRAVQEVGPAVVNITTGGAPRMTIEERLQPALQCQPEVASLNMGSMNFGLFPMLGRFKEFQHDWERQHLEALQAIYNGVRQDFWSDGGFAPF